ncbi:MAG: response regulator [Bacteroidetes bacterium]|nr:response regulator [Bacteroidota bacterium]
MSRPRILVIEDEEAVQDLYVDIFTEFEVVTASTGRDALALVEMDRHFDLYIVDVGLPDANGFDLISRIRKVDEKGKFVVGTGYPLDGLHDRISDTHPDLVFSKPFKITEFHEQVRTLVAA